MGEGNIGAWLKDAKLELSSNAWSGVEDFNWLKKVCARGGGGGGDSPPITPKFNPKSPALSTPLSRRSTAPTGPSYPTAIAACSISAHKAERRQGALSCFLQRGFTSQRMPALGEARDGWRTFAARNAVRFVQFVLRLGVNARMARILLGVAALCL